MIRCTIDRQLVAAEMAFDVIRLSCEFEYSLNEFSPSLSECSPSTSLAARRNARLEGYLNVQIKHRPNESV